MTRLGEPVCPCENVATLSLRHGHVFETIGGSGQCRACRYNSRWFLAPTQRVPWAHPDARGRGCAKRRIRVCELSFLWDPNCAATTQHHLATWMVGTVFVARLAGSG